jgi:hypothetical protein
LPDITSLSFRFAAELLVTVLVKVVGAVTRLFRAQRRVEPIALHPHLTNGGDFLIAPLSLVWSALSSSFDVNEAQIVNLGMSRAADGDWILQFMTSGGAFEATVAPSGLLVSVRRRGVPDNT